MTANSDNEQKQWCKRCDQGWVAPIDLSPKGKLIWFCDECDGIWFSKEILATPEGDLSTYLNTQGLSLEEFRNKLNTK